MKRLELRFAATFALALMSQPAVAGWKLLPAYVAVNAGGVTLTPSADWNLASGKLGKQTTAWTQDGFDLNSLEIFSGIPAGQPLYKERDRKRDPFPKFDPTVLLPDLIDLFERSFRAKNGVSDFSIIEVQPVEFGGKRGIRARFRYSMPDDELVRLGEVRFATANSKLYGVAFTAPALHYFDAGLPGAVAIMGSAKF